MAMLRRAFFGATFAACAHSQDTVSMVQSLVKSYQQTEPASSSCSTIDDGVLDDATAARSELVVIRGMGEDVRWLDALPEVPAVVYNRNGLDEMLPLPRANLRILPQQNTGGQEDCMLQHIVSNYDKLAKATLFLQGWPFWNCAGALREIRRALRHLARPQRQQLALAQNGAEGGLVPLTASFAQYSITEGQLGTWQGLVLGERRKRGMGKAEATQFAVSSYNATCSEVLRAPCPDEHWVAEGAQWAVSSNRIRSQPLSFYERLQRLKIPGDELQRRVLRGFVLEALWPRIWGSASWEPGEAVTKATQRQGANSLSSAEAVGNYCTLSTEQAQVQAQTQTGSPAARRSVCELDRRIAELPSRAIGLTSTSGRWTAHVWLQIVRGYSAGKQKKKVPPPPPSPSSSAMVESAPLCSKRRIWPLSIRTRIKNRESGKCIERTASGFVVWDCQKQVASQRLYLVWAQNGGYYQIQDVSEATCLSHGVGQAANCTTGAAEDQKWDLVSQGSGAYHIRAQGKPTCMVDTAGQLRLSTCTGLSALWQFSDVKTAGQYVDRYEYSLTRTPDGLLKMGCNMHLHSTADQVDLNLGDQPRRKRGRMAALRIIEAPAGNYYIADGEGRNERYLGCNSTTMEAALLEEKTPWKFQPISQSFVFVQSGEVVLQFQLANATLKCATLPLDGLPPENTTFAIEIQESDLVEIS